MCRSLDEIHSFILTIIFQGFCHEKSHSLRIKMSFHNIWARTRRVTISRRRRNPTGSPQAFPRIDNPNKRKHHEFSQIYARSGWWHWSVTLIQCQFWRKHNYEKKNGFAGMLFLNKGNFSIFNTSDQPRFVLCVWVYYLCDTILGIQNSLIWWLWDGLSWIPYQQRGSLTTVSRGLLPEQKRIEIDGRLNIHTWKQTCLNIT